MAMKGTNVDRKYEAVTNGKVVLDRIPEGRLTVISVLDAVPDGWAKIDGEWVRLEEVGLIHQTCSPKTCKHYGVEGAF